MVTTTAPAPAIDDDVWMWWVCQGTRKNAAGQMRPCEHKLLRRSLEFCGRFDIICPSCKTANRLER